MSYVCLWVIRKRVVSLKIISRQLFKLVTPSGTLDTYLDNLLLAQVTKAVNNGYSNFTVMSS